MTTRYHFPNRENRNRFLRLVAANVGEYGYGFGLEFDGLEYAIDHAEGRGDLISQVPPRAKGKWSLSGNQVELDWSFIAENRVGFEKLRAHVWEIATQFGAG